MWCRRHGVPARLPHASRCAAISSGEATNGGGRSQCLSVERVLRDVDSGVGAQHVGEWRAEDVRSGLVDGHPSCRHRDVPDECLCRVTWQPLRCVVDPWGRSTAHRSMSRRSRISALVRSGCWASRLIVATAERTALDGDDGVQGGDRSAVRVRVLNVTHVRAAASDREPPQSWGCVEDHRSGVYRWRHGRT